MRVALAIVGNLSLVALAWFATQEFDGVTSALFIVITMLFSLSITGMALRNEKEEERV